MKNSNSDIETILNKITSLTNILNDSHWEFELSEEDKQIIKDFFSQDSKVYKRAMTLYWQAMSYVVSSSDKNESDNTQINSSQSKSIQTNSSPTNSNTSDSTKASTIDSTPQEFDDGYEALVYMMKMGKLLRILYAKKIDPILDGYTYEYEQMFKDIGCKAREIFLSNNIENLSTLKRSGIDFLMKVWAVTDESIFEMKDFINFKNRMQKTQEPLDSEVDKRYFLNFVRILTEYRIMGPVPLTKDTIEMHIKYWFGQVDEKLKSNNIDAIFENELVNIFFQVMDRGLFRSFVYVPIDESAIDNQRKELLSLPCFSDDKIDEAKRTMDEIIDRYRTTPIGDEYDLKQYYDAYKVVFLKDFLSNNQEEENTNHSLNYARFIFVHAEDFKNTDQSSKINYMNLFKRAVCDYCLKDSKRQFCEQFDNNELNNVICYSDSDCNYSSYWGYASKMGVASVVHLDTLLITQLPDPIQLINVITHEVNHCATDIYLFGETNLGFESYMSYKTRIANEFRSYIIGNNYEDLYFEIRARLAECHSEMSLFKCDFIEDDEKSNKINLLKSKMEDLYHDSLYNKLTDGKKRRLAINIFDEIVKEKKEDLDLDVPFRISSGSKLAEILLMEYHADGTHKTLQEILDDQEKEMETGKFITKAGPQTTLERLKFRLNVMMYRAVAYDKQEEFVEVSNRFLQKHHDELFQYDFFKEVFPKGVLPTGVEATEAYTRLAQNYENPNIEFLYDLGEVVRSAEKMAANRKEEFGRQVINAAQKTAMSNSTQTQSYIPDEQEDPIQ